MSERKIAISGTIGSGKSTVLNYLKTKGYKVFSCDEYNAFLLKEENEDVVNYFLSKNNQFFTSKEEKINILPSANEDGFFICIIHKK